MGSPLFDYESPIPNFTSPFGNTLFAPDATVVITNGQVTFNKPLSLFPVPTVPNGSTALPPINLTEAELLGFAHYLMEKADDLWKAVTKSRKATEELAGAVATMQTLAGLATLLSNRAAMAKKGPASIAKAKKLATAAEAMAVKAAEKLGKDVPNSENVEAGIKSLVQGRYNELEDAMRNPDLIALWDTYWNDKQVPEERKAQFLYEFEEVLSRVVEIMSRCREHERTADLALESFNDPESTLFGKVLALADQVAGVAGSSVGNMPGPDSLALSLVKCYATYWLPKAAVSQNEARKLEGVLHTLFHRSMNFTKRDASLFRDYYIRVADAQHAVAVDERRLLLLRGAAKPALDRIQKAEDALRKTQAKAQTESDRLRNFLIDFNKKKPKEPASYNKFDRFQSGAALSSALTVLSIIQLVNACMEWDDVEKPTVKKVMDVFNASVGSGLGLIYTVNKFPIPMSAVKTRLAFMEAKVAGQTVARSVAVLGIVTGGVDLFFALTGDEGIDQKGVVTSSAQIASSVLFLLGLLLTNPALTAIGMVIAVGFGIYSLVDFIIEALKTETENVFKGLLKLLETKKLSWNNKELYKLLGCEGDLATVKAAVDQMDWFLIPVDYTNPKDEGSVRDALTFLGFEKKTIDELLVKRPQPPLLLPGFYPPPVYPSVI